MKLKSILICILPLLLLGCKREAPSSAPPPAESRIISDGTNSWHLGSVTMNGTNVPLTNVSIRVITNLTQ